jgi:hypothetical protein
LKKFSRSGRIQRGARLAQPATLLSDRKGDFKFVIQFFRSLGQTSLDVNSYDVIFGYDVREIWKGKFVLEMIGAKNNCMVRLGDHSVNPVETTKDHQTTKIHNFDHDYIGIVKYIKLITTAKFKNWPMEYIWVKHSNYQGQVSTDCRVEES